MKNKSIIFVIKIFKNKKIFDLENKVRKRLELIKHNKTDSFSKEKCPKKKEKTRETKD